MTKTEQKYGKMIRIPWRIFEVCEKKASAQRRKTGKQVFWTTILIAIIDEALSKGD